MAGIPRFSSSAFRRPLRGAHAGCFFRSLLGLGAAGRVRNPSDAVASFLHDDEGALFECGRRRRQRGPQSLPDVRRSCIVQPKQNDGGSVARTRRQDIAEVEIEGQNDASFLRPLGEDIAVRKPVRPCSRKWTTSYPSARSQSTTRWDTPMSARNRMNVPIRRGSLPPA